MIGTPKDSCDALLKTLCESNLNFIVSEPLFSIKICVRKKFINNATKRKKSVLLTKESLEEKCESLANQNKELKDTLEEVNKPKDNLKMTNKPLQLKLENAEEKLFKICEQKKESKATVATFKAKVRSLESL